MTFLLNLAFFFKMYDVSLEEETDDRGPSEHVSEKSHSARDVEKVLSVTDIERTLSAHGSEKSVSEKSQSVVGSAKSGSAAGMLGEDVTKLGNGTSVYLQLLQDDIWIFKILLQQDKLM